MAVNAAAVHTDGQRFVVSASSGHAIVSDADRASNSAPGPMELVLMGLCACSATDLVIVLNKSRQPYSRIAVRAAAERAPEPPQVYTAIHLVYEVGGAVDRAVVERAVRLSQEKYCSVYAMLKHTAAMTHELAIDPS